MKGIEGQLFDEDPGTPISLVHIQQPYKDVEPFGDVLPGDNPF